MIQDGEAVMRISLHADTANNVGTSLREAGRCMHALIEKEGGHGHEVDTAKRRPKYGYLTNIVVRFS